MGALAELDALPSGIVTFVFTDIEGSTRLLRRLGDRYTDVLDRHRELLRGAWHEHGGVEVETEGDAMLAAFADPSAAIRGCVAAQRALLREPWPADGTVKVRIGVHSGLAYPRAGGYVALAVHQASRVVAAAHGGQVLVSAQSAGIADDRAGVSLTSVGRFRLRDFDEPVELFQVAADALPDAFPSVRALPAQSHNLVRPPTSFVGREDALRAVAALIAPRRLVSVVGPGGVGKTRLVTELGLQVARAWPDGVWFVDLSLLQDAALIPATVASAIDCPVANDAETWPAVITRLRDLKALLIFDNCEHVIEAVARHVTDVLRGCVDVAVLATSREPLGAGAEQVWRLAPLVANGAAVAPAIRLFAARARAVRPTFELDAVSAPVVAEICNRLDGLPLAIELAAARVSVISPNEILAGLDDRFRLLRSKERLGVDRQRTLEGLLDWSYQLLSASERAALRRLGVFAGSFDLDTATAALVDATLGHYDIPDLVWSLAEKSLISVEPTANATRYRLFDSIRAYALQQLGREGELESTVGRLTDRFLEQLGPWVAGTNAVLGRRTIEIDNLRGLVWLLAKWDEPRALRVAYSIAKCHQHHGSAGQCAAEVRTYLDHLALPSPDRVALMCVLVQSLNDAGEAAAAVRLAADAAALSEIVGAPSWDSSAVERARVFAALASADYAGAVQIIQSVLPTIMDDNLRASALSQLHLAASGVGDLQTALEAIEESLALDVKLGLNTAVHQNNLAELCYRECDYAAAARHQRAALIEASETGHPVFLAFSMILAARLDGDRRTWPVAVRLHAHAEAMLRRIGVVMYPDDQQSSAQFLERARAHLGSLQYETERRNGEQLSLPDAIQLADDALRTIASDPGADRSITPT